MKINDLAKLHTLRLYYPYFCKKFTVLILKKNISIIGCGWLGFSLAQLLIKKEYYVKGSTTSLDKLKQLQKAKINAHQIILNENGIIGNYVELLSKSETVIINIPPGLRKHPTKNHVLEFSHLIKAIEKHSIKNVLYVSSTSVFKDSSHFPKITDTTLPNATTNSTQQLIEIEQQLINNSNFNTTILRFGGLFGADRHPAKYLSGKTNLSHPDAPINLIHREDCIDIITLILEKDIWNTTFNAVYPIHPTKQSYYTNYCKRHNLALPEFNTKAKSKGKVIDSSKLVQLLNYTFKQAP